MAVVIRADEVAMASGTATARAVRAGPRAFVVVTRAVHVARSLRTAKVADSAARAAALSVRAGAAARITVAIDVARRRLARKVTVATGPARAITVAARSPALVVVALADDVARRFVARELARRPRSAHAISAVAIVVVVTRDERGRDAEQARDGEASNERYHAPYGSFFLPSSFEVRCSPSSLVMRRSMAASFSRRSPSSY